MFIMSKALLISSATTVIVRAGAAIWLNPFATVCLMCVVPSLKSVVFCTHVPYVCLACLLLCKEEGSSPVSLNYCEPVVGMHLALWYVVLVCHQYKV